jgi:hypothetical protein
MPDAEVPGRVRAVARRTRSAGVRAQHVIGRRGTALLLISATFCAYGTGIILGYEPTFASALHVPIIVYGWAAVGSGLFTLTGVPHPVARLQFSYAVMVTALWALLVATHWTESFGWAAGISWLSVSTLAFLVSGWPEGRK